MRARLIAVTLATHEWIDRRMATAADLGLPSQGATKTPEPPPHVLERPALRPGAEGDAPPLPTVQPPRRTDH